MFRTWAVVDQARARRLRCPDRGRRGRTALRQACRLPDQFLLLLIAGHGIDDRATGAGQSIEGFGERLERRRIMGMVDDDRAASDVEHIEACGSTRRRRSETTPVPRGSCRATVASTPGSRRGGQYIFDLETDAPRVSHGDLGQVCQEVIRVSLGQHNVAAIDKRRFSTARAVFDQHGMVRPAAQRTGRFPGSSRSTVRRVDLPH